MPRHSAQPGAQLSFALLYTRIEAAGKAWLAPLWTAMCTAQHGGPRSAAPPSEEHGESDELHYAALVLPARPDPLEQDQMAVVLSQDGDGGQY